MSKPGSPRHIDNLLREAVELQQNGALDEAETAYREILALRPRHFDALQLLGALALQSGRYDEGVDLLKKAADIDSRQAPVHSNLAFALNVLGRHDAALAAANRAIALKSGFVDALNNRGMALAGLNRPEEALASFEKALAGKPDFPEAWSNRSCALRDLGRPDDAIASCDRAVALRPNYAEAWSNRGNALSDLNRPLEAQASYERALAAADLADAWNNLGLTFVDMNRHADALACYERALALSPDSAETHWNRALCLLQTGELAAGFAEYEWRWQRKRIQEGRRNFDAPLWLGETETSLAGKTILLHAEQGLGDTLQFCRYATLVAAQGARVVLEVQPELMRLLAPLPGVTELVPAGEPLPAFDYQSPLLSLPLALQTTAATIPAGTPYLFANAAASQRFRHRIDEAAQPGALKIGLVWAGGHRPHVPELRKNDARRSLAFERFAPIVEVPGVQFFSLQKGPAAQQLDAMRGHHEASWRVIDWTDELNDFADTAALVDNLDLVISVDTSTAHLAGAMNKPVWILNRLDTCWRWMLEREDSPWYPSARLFRQPTLGDWDSVIEAVTRELTQRAASSTDA